MISQPSGPPQVSVAVGMLATINLDDKAFFEADEINDKSANRSLALEFNALKTMGTQKKPEPAFGIRHARRALA